jgi:hypothetical protein
MQEVRTTKTNMKYEGVERETEPENAFGSAGDRGDRRGDALDTGVCAAVWAPRLSGL